jgi:hypothetical protein
VGDAYLKPTLPNQGKRLKFFFFKGPSAQATRERLASAALTDHSQLLSRCEQGSISHGHALPTGRVVSRTYFESVSVDDRVVTSWAVVVPSGQRTRSRRGALATEYPKKHAEDDCV